MNHYFLKITLLGREGVMEVMVVMEVIGLRAGKSACTMVKLKYSKQNLPPILYYNPKSRTQHPAHHTPHSLLRNFSI
jgi:hypothetical protein